MAMLQEIKEGKFYIGSLPWPIFIGCSILIIIAAWFDLLPKSLISGFAVILPLGWLLGTIGQNIPLLKKFGTPAILSLIIPSIMVYYNVFDANTLAAAKMLMKDFNFLLFYIASLVCGSILGMRRTILVNGFIRMMIPMLLGMFFTALADVGILQLSNACSDILKQDYDLVLSTIL